MPPYCSLTCTTSTSGDEANGASLLTRFLAYNQIQFSRTEGKVFPVSGRRFLVRVVLFVKDFRTLFPTPCPRWSVTAAGVFGGLPKGADIWIGPISRARSF